MALKINNQDVVAFETKQTTPSLVITRNGQATLYCPLHTGNENDVITNTNTQNISDSHFSENNDNYYNYDNYVIPQVTDTVNYTLGKIKVSKDNASIRAVKSGNYTKVILCNGMTYYQFLNTDFETVPFTTVFKVRPNPSSTYRFDSYGVTIYNQGCIYCYTDTNTLEKSVQVRGNAVNFDHKYSYWASTPNISVTALPLPCGDPTDSIGQVTYLSQNPCGTITTRENYFYYQGASNISYSRYKNGKTYTQNNRIICAGTVTITGEAYVPKTYIDFNFNFSVPFKNLPNVTIAKSPGAASYADTATDLPYLSVQSLSKTECTLRSQHNVVSPAHVQNYPLRYMQVTISGEL